MLEGLCFLRKVGREVAPCREGVGQEHGKELKKAWNMAQGNITAGAGDLIREHAQGWLRGTRARLRLTESVFPCMGLLSLPRL